MPRRQYLGLMFALLVTGVPTAGMQTQATTSEWAVSWRTGHRLPGSKDVVIFGGPEGLPIQLLIENVDAAKTVTIPPIAQTLRTWVFDENRSAQASLACDPTMRHVRTEGGSTTYSEDVPSSVEIVLYPQQSLRVECTIAQSGGRAFPAGRYRIEIEVPWQAAAVPKSWWHVVIRQPQTREEQLQMLLSDASESFRRQDFRQAKTRFESAVGLDPDSLPAALGLAGALERLDDHARAIDVLRRSLNAHQRNKDERQQLIHRLAVDYAVLGDETTARQLFKEIGTPPQAVSAILADVRRKRELR